jgi:hypothetical protein
MNGEHELAVEVLGCPRPASGSVSKQVAIAKLRFDRYLDVP